MRLFPPIKDRLSQMATTEVVFLTRILTHYRVPFHERVRDLLAARGVKYRLLFSRPNNSDLLKNDLAKIEWAEEVPRAYFGPLCWQAAIKTTNDASLIVVGQENRLLTNYVLQLRWLLGGAPVAFFGHGRNFQSQKTGGLRESIKARLSKLALWWFAYTDISASIMIDRGFPAERITTFNNAIDTLSLATNMANCSESEKSKIIEENFEGSHNIAIYIGGLYSEKRIDFLIEAATHVRQIISDFHLIIVGDGSLSSYVENAAMQNDWVHFYGSKFGEEKALLMAISKLMLMPGLVGLAVLDSFVAGTPIVTTEINYHSPEISYLIDNYNGIIAKEDTKATEYGDLVVRLLHDEKIRGRLAAGALASAKEYSIENMAERFAAGVSLALELSAAGGQSQ